MKMIQLILALFIGLSVFGQDYPKGLYVNDRAPFFNSKDQNGRNFSLKEKLEQGPVVLVFYRGQWCPYCNRALKRLEDSLSLLQAKGATLVAVTPEKPENIGKTIEKTKASYSILFDEGMKIMKSYEVAYAVSNETIESYRKYGIDFSEANGSNGANLPVPAVYIINNEGKIVYRFFDVDYKKRPSVQELLDHL